jgi:hypothetical protein
MILKSLKILLGVVSVAGLFACGSDGLRLRPAFFAASSEVIDFGEVDVGRLEERTLFVINKGDKVLKLQPPDGNTLGGIFSIVLPENEVEALSDVKAQVYFQPAGANVFETIMLLENDSTNEPFFEITLRGSGKSTDPCAGVVCNEPPPSACLDFGTSRYYPPFGTCVDGQCIYEPVDQVCEHQCDLDSGLCQGDPCVGVACQSPPNTCFHANGTCSAGACVYTAANSLNCDDGNACTINDSCQEGACRGTPKQCNAPPAAACLNTGTLRQWEPLGTCDNSGNCRYAPRDVPCEYGCTAGQCQNDPCAGGCDDGNPCTIDSCQATVGCRHDANEGGSCASGSGDCPVGRCSGTTCLPQAGVTCQAEIDVDLCADVEVAGVCSASGDCPVGRCSGTTCLPQAGVTCEAEVDVDLCADIEIAGVCSASGECIVEEVPAQFTCPGCPGICLQCYFIQLCIPIFE